MQVNSRSNSRTLSSPYAPKLRLGRFNTFTRRSYLGIRDSSRTRVAPVFDRLHVLDPSGCTWLADLLTLPKMRDQRRLSVLPPLGPLREAHWWPQEKMLPAPASLLEWLVNNPPDPDRLPPGALASQPHRRQNLLSADLSAREEALRLLAAGQRTRGWHVLEGASQPDVFLATDEIVVVIEGKRTEPGPTLHTRWMPIRHQMLRHMDAATEISAGRHLFGFFIVEGGLSPDDLSVSDQWLAAAVETVTPAAVERSLPHRTPEERESITSGFLGVTTWQAVCRALEISWSCLPDVVVDD